MIPTNNGRLDPAATAALLVKADETSRRRETAMTATTTLMVDGGVENFNGAVNELVEQGGLRRIVAQTDVRFSNSLIERFWRALKYTWCFLYQLDDLSTLKRLVVFYVDQHNRVLPHAAFDGQTPDEMYFGSGDGVASQLEEARARARASRLDANRSTTCTACAWKSESHGRQELPPAAHRRPTSAVRNRTSQDFQTSLRTDSYSTEVTPTRRQPVTNRPECQRGQLGNLPGPL